MRLNEFNEPNESHNDHEGIIFGKKIPDWFTGDDDAAIFSSTTGFDSVQVYRSPHGKYVADYGKGNIQEYLDAGTLENQLRKKRMTRFERIEPYNPSR